MSHSHCKKKLKSHLVCYEKRWGDGLFHSLNPEAVRFSYLFFKKLVGNLACFWSDSNCGPCHYSRKQKIYCVLTWQLYDPDEEPALQLKESSVFFNVKMQR